MHTGVKTADERLGNPPPRVHSGAFSGHRQGWKNPKRTLWQCWQCTASVYVGCSNALLGDFLGVSRSVECDFFCLSCLILGFSLAFILLYRCLLVTTVTYYYVISFFAAHLLCWFNCQYLPSDWLERLLWGCLLVKEIIPQRPGQKALLCILCQFVCLSLALPIQYISYIYGTI